MTNAQKTFLYITFLEFLITRKLTCFTLFMLCGTDKLQTELHGTTLPCKKRVKQQV